MYIDIHIYTYTYILDVKYMYIDILDVKYMYILDVKYMYIDIQIYTYTCYIYIRCNIYVIYI
jgi:hypothetical protein